MKEAGKQRTEERIAKDRIFNCQKLCSNDNYYTFTLNIYVNVRIRIAEINLFVTFWNDFEMNWNELS